MSGDRGLASLVFVVLAASATAYVSQSGIGVPPSSGAAATAPQAAGRAAGEPGTQAAGSARPAYRDAITLIEEHLGLVPTTDPAWASEEGFVAVHSNRTLEQERRDRIRRVRESASATKVEFVIATLPDAIDSNARWQFDPIYDSLQRAIGASGFVLDRFYIPDWDAARNPDTDARAAGRLHERAPGIVLFRGDEKLLVVFLVFETATGGVHQVAFRRAVWTIAQWCECAAAVRVIGPTFSGSIQSLGRAIAQARADLERILSYRIVTGAATSGQNAEILGHIVGEAAEFSYHATVLKDDEVLRALAGFLADRIGRDHVAVLVEGNTAYGGALRDLLQGGTGPRLCTAHCAVLPFPLHISRLRNAAENAGLLRAAGAADASRSLPLLLDEPTAPTDQVPSMAPRLTSSSSDLALAAILDTIDREDIRAVGLFATDARDKLFLAQQIALRSPDVLLFTIEGDQLLAHPDFRRYTHGMIVASSYPLFMGTQLWKPTATGREARHQFASTNAQGVYNATLAVLSYQADGLARPAMSTPVLLDYRAPDGPISRPGPFAWISVVGRDGIWPLHRDPVGCEAADCWSYLQPIRPAGDPSSDDRPIHTSPWMLVLFVGLQLMVLLHIASKVRRTWSRVPDAPASNETVARGWELACCVALLVAQLGALTVLIGHNDVLYAYAVPGSEAAAARAWNSFALFVAVAVTAFLAATTIATGAAGSLRAWLRDVPLTTAVVLAAIGVVSILGIMPGVGALLGDDSLTLLNRGLQPFSGVSPFVPVLIVITALYAFAAMQRANALRPSLMRRGSGALAALAVGDFVRLIDRAGAAVRTPVEREDRSLWVIVAALAAATFFAYVQEVQTAGSTAFDAFYLTSWLLLQALICVALVQHYRLWRATKELLKALSVHPMVEAFRSVPRDLFANRWPSRGPRLIHLQHVVNAYAGLKEALTSGAAADLQSELEHEDTEQSKRLNTCLAADLASASPPSIPSSTTWLAVGKRMETILPRLTTFWQTHRPTEAVNDKERDKDENRRWQVEAGVFLAIPVALMIRELMARVARGLYVIIGIVVLLAVYSIAIPVYPRRALYAVTWIYVLVAVATTMMAILSAERDVVLSRLSGTAPGRIEWDAAFLRRTILPVLIVLLTLFTMQFPEAGSAILRWLRPVQIALP
jgi:hypothetical protein